VGHKNPKMFPTIKRRKMKMKKKKKKTRSRTRKKMTVRDGLIVVQSRLILKKLNNCSKNKNIKRKFLKRNKLSKIGKSY
jgi:hypothetical protein